FTHFLLGTVGKLLEDIGVHVTDMRDAGSAAVRLERRKVSVGAAIQTNHGQVEPVIRTENLTIALRRRSHCQPRRSYGQRIEKLASRNHHSSLAGNSSPRQRLFESVHADAGGGFGRSCAAPVGFKAEPVVETITLQSLHLP